MSNYLTKPYEITLWKDDPSGAEVKICTIGSHMMKGQNRAFEPLFSRNVNGVKKLSFKIYKKYVDTQTGEVINNPYMPYLISERKVKLYLPEEPSDNQWHDFIIKNVSENSATHLCTYQLEDALVQELSKNGFGVTLDAKLMNNIGTANKLAEFVLRETDWDVSESSEAFVQTIDEALVYLTFPNDTELDTRTTENTNDRVIDNITVYKIIGQQKDDMSSGITLRELTSEEKNTMAGKTILAFYSSCAGKPHRFQFLYSRDGTYDTEEELSNYISNEVDYQYYIDFDNPENDYTVQSSNYTLPIGFNTTTCEEYEGTATTLSSKYRGRRYGFSQQARYIPVLDRYVQLYNKVDEDGEYIEDENGDKVVYYGYEHAEYKSPALTQNMISNSTFESTSGWTGTKNGTGEKAKVEAVYGYFSNNKFINAIDELKNGTFDPVSTENPQGKDYKAYLKLDFKGANSTVINSGPFDNRALIGNMVAGDKWALDYICLDKTGTSVKNTGVYETNPINFSLGEYKYFSIDDDYSSPEYDEGDETERVLITRQDDEERYQIFSVNETEYPYSNESFKKKMNVRLEISTTTPEVYYLENIELFKVAYCDGDIIPLEEQGSSLEDRTIEKTYYYFTDDALDGITNAEQLIPEATAKTLSYTTYKPVYNEGAQKVRTVTAKESNYFNILQSIAETFEAWLTFDITRENGGITGKKIAFKNYIGGDNYACFRYGTNLKDIQRTFESKNIVTKLIVKNNSNEHANGGFCTIQRASANPTGENYIYDFQYFFNQGLMDARQYLDTLYVIDGAQGPDSAIWTSGVDSGTLNLQGYFPRIKALNNKIKTESELLTNIAQDLTKYKADLAVAEAGLDAATSGIEEVREDFLLLTGVAIDMLSGHTINSVQVGTKQDSENEAKDNRGWYYTDRDWIGNVSVIPSEDKQSINVTVSITGDASDSERSLYIKVYPTISLSKNGITATLLQYYSIKCIIEANATSGSGSVDIEVVNSSRNDVQKKLQEYAVYVTNENRYSPEKTTLQTQVDALEAQYNTKQDYIENSLKEWKRQLNQLFFQTYSRFIQEGTWISEEYVDDGLYYADAQSVMYNSCYPQVAYTINVISVEGLPGYEGFKYKLGEKTWVIDPDFFGDEDREPVIITEIVENLDDRSQNQIKVQNFKNQFQDLFQKITATVQQAQYSTGSYERAVALAEANQERKNQFLSDALDSANSKFFVGKQPSVRLTNEGLIIENPDSPSDAIKMVGGAILLSKQNEHGEQKWVTGVTSDGVSASLITAGVLNAGEISIMNYDEPVFRWDSFGISAYDAIWYDGGEAGTVISGVNTQKFVRFDKHGIYGINGGVDGANWHPTGAEYGDDPLKEIDDRATFALTWEGLKVSGNDGVIAKLGKLDGYILKIGKEEEENPLLSFDNSGVLRVGAWSVSQNGLISVDGEQQSVATYSLRRVAPVAPNIFLVPTPIEINVDQFYSSQSSSQTDNIVFKAGDNFLVSEAGTLYARNGRFSGHIEADSGRIGPMAIDAVGQHNKNLVLQSDTPYESNAYLVATYNMSEDWELDTEYTITIKGVTNSGFGVWANGAQTDVAYLEPIGGGLYQKTFTTPDSIIIQFPKTVRIYNTPNGERSFEASIEWIKIEKGSLGTPWSAAPEDSMQSNINNNSYSWRFSTTDGINMWNGSQDDDHKVFELNSDNLYINATAGEIASWVISSARLGYVDQSNNNNSLYLYGRDSNIAFGNTTLGMTAGAEVERESGKAYSDTRTLTFTYANATNTVDYTFPENVPNPILRNLSTSFSKYTEENLSSYSASSSGSITVNPAYLKHNYRITSDSDASISFDETFPVKDIDVPVSQYVFKYNYNFEWQVTGGPYVWIKSTKTYNLNNIKGKKVVLTISCNGKTWNINTTCPTSTTDMSYNGFNASTYVIQKDDSGNPAVLFAYDSSATSANLYIRPTLSVKDVRLWQWNTDYWQSNTTLEVLNQTIISNSYVEGKQSVVWDGSAGPQIVYRYYFTSQTFTPTAASFTIPNYFSSLVNSSATLVSNYNSPTISASFNNSNIQFPSISGAPSYTSAYANSVNNPYCSASIKAASYSNGTLTYTFNGSVSSSGYIDCIYTFSSNDVAQLAYLLEHYPSSISLTIPISVRVTPPAFKVEMSSFLGSIDLSNDESVQRITYTFNNSNGLYNRKATVQVTTSGAWYGQTYAFVLGKDGSITTNKASLGDIDATSIKMWDAGRNRYATVSIRDGAWVIT